MLEECPCPWAQLPGSVKVQQCMLCLWGSTVALLLNVVDIGDDPWGGIIGEPMGG
jgi:hypothetical protein